MINLVPELTKKEFNSFIKEGTVLIDFFAEGCMPCVMMGPIIEDLNKEFNGKIKIGKLNVDDYSETANKFKISSIPNFILFKNGEPVEELTGAITKEGFEETIKRHL